MDRRQLLLPLFFVGLFGCSDATRVDTDVGEFIGHEYTSPLFADKNGIQFLGIPYAEPPTGEKRFTKPVIKGRLPDPFNASSYGPSCIQPPFPLLTLLATSEDCLTLNIFVPAHALNGSKVAVMIWIHGGGFVFGNSDFADPSNLAIFGDVIVVSMNYRLGIFGFISTGDEASPGNYGLWDQHLAIRWVNQHINKFGGDKEKITIFGESAGGASVDYQGMYSENRGLFQRIIAESGAITSAWAHEKITSMKRKQLGDLFGCNTETSRQIIECIKRKTSDELVNKASILIYSNSIDSVRFVPVFDGEFVNYDPSTLHQENPERNISWWDGVEYMTGINNFDGALYSPYLSNENSLEKQPIVKEFLIPQILEIYNNDTNVRTIIQKLINYKYTENESSKAAKKKLLDFFTDACFAAPAIKSIQNFKMADQKKAYVYLFNRSPSFATLDLLPAPGANHGEELAYVFGFSQIMEYFRKIYNFNISDIRDDEMAFSKSMMTYWTNFAKSGNPNLPVTKYISTKWPEYTLEEQKFLEFGSDIKQNDHLYADRIAFWLDLIPSIKLQEKECPSDTSNAVQISSHTFHAIFSFTILLNLIF